MFSAVGKFLKRRKPGNAEAAADSASGAAKTADGTALPDSVDEPAAPAPAPYLGQHTEEVLAERLGLSSGAIGKLVDRDIARLSDKD